VKERLAPGEIKLLLGKYPMTVKGTVVPANSATDALPCILTSLTQLSLASTVHFTEE
jgi:hypothetical protein